MNTINLGMKFKPKENPILDRYYDKNITKDKIYEISYISKDKEYFSYINDVGNTVFRKVASFDKYFVKTEESLQLGIKLDLRKWGKIVFDIDNLLNYDESLIDCEECRRKNRYKLNDFKNLQLYETEEIRKSLYRDYCLWVYNKEDRMCIHNTVSVFIDKDGITLFPNYRTKFVDISYLYDKIEELSKNFDIKKRLYLVYEDFDAEFEFFVKYKENKD